MDTRFNEIEILRIPLIILVLFIHVIPAQIEPIELSWDSGSVYTLLTEVISHHLGRIAVPAFFLFSGYFFFFSVQIFTNQVYATQIIKRMRTLVIPFFLWNAIFFLVVLFKNFLFKKMGMMEDELYTEIKAASYLKIFWEGPLLYPLWYLRDLICMVVLSPLFYLLFKYLRGFGMAVLMAAYFLLLELNIPGLSTTAFFFFGAGAFLGISKYNLPDLGMNHKGAKVLIAVMLLGISSYFSGTPYYEYCIRLFIPCGLIALLCMGNALGKTKKLSSYLAGLSSSVFFIYAIHSIYIINWVKGGFAKFAISNAGWGKVISYLTIPMVCLLVCLGFYSLLKKFFPNMLAILIGGRAVVKPLKNTV